VIVPAVRSAFLLFESWDLFNASRLRQNLLIADRFAIDEGQMKRAVEHAELLSELYPRRHNKSDLRTYLSDFEQLVGMGYVDLVSLRKVGLTPEVKAQADLLDKSAMTALNEKPQLRVVPEEPKMSARSIELLPTSAYELAKNRADLLRARSFAADSSTIKHHMFSVGSTSTDFIDSRSKSDSSSSSVLKVVLNNLPFPASDVPLEDVIQFREASRQSLISLRKWMVDLANLDPSEAEIQTALEAALEDYRASCRKQRFGLVTDSLKLLMAAVPAVVESIASGQFTGLAKAAFQVTIHGASLLEKERASHGRELAYIQRSAARFE
jgi:Family of unknown function (DUF6236)